MGSTTRCPSYSYEYCGSIDPGLMVSQVGLWLAHRIESHNCCAVAAIGQRIRTKPSLGRSEKDPLLLHLCSRIGYYRERLLGIEFFPQEPLKSSKPYNTAPVVAYIHFSFSSFCSSFVQHDTTTTLNKTKYTVVEGDIHFTYLLVHRFRRRYTIRSH